MAKVAVIVPSYNGAWRCDALFKSLWRYDKAAWDAPWLVVEDPCGILGVPEQYDELKRKHPVEVVHLTEWRNMHGAAIEAFRIASVMHKPEWVIYLGDDVLVTPGCISNMLAFLENDLKTVGLVLFPYWNAHDLAEGWGKVNDFRGPALLKSKDDMYLRPFDEWLPNVPENKHWNGDGYARPYINVNGVGFAAHLPTYHRVGGIAEGTWCLDESLSLRVWRDSDRGVVCLPGPPLVHYFGASTFASPKPHDLNTEERWIEAMGLTKQESGELSTRIMNERAEAILAETRACTYWRNRDG